MAQHTTVRLVDDIDGSAAEETIAFGLDGKTYEIDLNSANAARLRAAVVEYVKAARAIKRRPGSRLGLVESAAGRAPRGEAQEKRAWLAANGFPEVVGRRGRFTLDEEQAWAARDDAGAVTESSPDATEVVEPPVVAPRKGGGADAEEGGEAPQGAAGASGTNTRMTGLSSAQVGSLREFTGLVVESGASWALLKGFPVDVVAEVERVRDTTVFPSVGEKRALSFVVKKLYNGKGVKTVDAA